MTGLRTRVLKSGGWVAGSTGIVALAQLAQLVILARLLSPADFGVVAVLMVVQGFVEMLMVAGVANAIIQRDEPSELELSSLHWLNTILGGVLGVGIALSSPLVGEFFDNAAAVVPIGVLALAVPINAQSHVSRACLERAMRFRTVAMTESIAGVVTVCAIVVSTAVWGIVGVALGMVMGFTVRSILFLRAGRSQFRIRRSFSFSRTRRFLDFGVFQFLNALVGFIDGNIATIMIGRGLPAGVLGGYSLAYNTSVNVPGKLNPVVTRVLFPALSRVRHDSKRFSDGVLSLITATGLINTPLMLALGVTAPALVPSVFGTKWDWVVPLVQILALCGFIRSVANPMGVVLMASDRQRLGLVVNIGKTAVSFVFIAIGIHLLGVRGVALAMVASGILTLLINHLLLRYLLSARLSGIVWAHVQPLLAAVPAAAVGLGLMHLMRSSGMTLVSTVLVGASIAVVYIFTVLVIRVPVAVQLTAAVLGRRRRRRPSGDEA